MGGLFSSDSGEGKGYEEMARYLKQGLGEREKYHREALQYLMPYYQAGTGAMGDYQTALNKMSNPQQFYQQLMQGYDISPQAKFQQEQALKASNAAASAGGMLGGGAQQKALTEFAQKNIAADQQRWLDNQTNIWGRYLEGKGGIMNQGAQMGGMLGQAATGTGQDIASILSEIGKAKYGKSVADARDRGNIFSSILGFGTSLLGGLTGGFGGGGGLVSSLFGGGNNMPTVPASMVGVPRRVSPSYYNTWPSYRGG